MTDPYPEVDEDAIREQVMRELLDQGELICTGIGPHSSHDERDTDD